MDEATKKSIPPIVELALAEDVGDGDLTAALLPEDVLVEAEILSRGVGVLCGMGWVEEVFRRVSGGVTVEWGVGDGDAVGVGDVVARVSGAARGVLMGERTALNFLQTLSGTATASREYFERVRGLGVTLLDTRKTLPGLRLAQKYAVRVGGCQNHRRGLYDGFLIKENHIRAYGGGAGAIVTEAVAAARGRGVVVEVGTVGELEEAVKAGAEWVMLDNFDLPRLREAVAANRGRARLECSGGVEAGRLGDIAASGVDCISIGALTKNCQALDLSLLIR